MITSPIEVADLQRPEICVCVCALGGGVWVGDVGVCVGGGCVGVCLLYRFLHQSKIRSKF
jgi:hypothetical protein